MPVLLDPFKFAAPAVTPFFTSGCASLLDFDTVTNCTVVTSQRNGSGIQQAFNAVGPGKNLGANKGKTIAFGFAYKKATIVTSELVQFYGDSAGTLHVRMSLTSSGALQVNCAGSTLGNSATGLIVANTWHYIEIACFMDDTVGTAVVAVDGVTVLNLSGKDTKNGGTDANYDHVRIKGLGGTAFCDDIYLAASATPLGDPGAL